MKRPAVLTIAGSDCSGGAGIQADLKTMTAFGVYGMSVITAVTAQNTTGVYGIQKISGEMVASQLDAVFADIVPAAVKIGMLADGKTAGIVAEKLLQYGAENIVVDPVMLSTSGSRLLDREGVEILVSRIFPMARLITPNVPEAESLSGMEIRTGEDMEKAAAALSCGCGVLVKGGHLSGAADDLLYDKGGATWFSSPRIDNPNTHGTGCTLSSAIASGLAKGWDLEDSVRKGKTYINAALKAGLDLGKGNGPLDHLAKRFY